MASLTLWPKLGTDHTISSLPTTGLGGTVWPGARHFANTQRCRVLGMSLLSSNCDGATAANDYNQDYYSRGFCCCCMKVCMLVVPRESALERQRYRYESTTHATASNARKRMQQRCRVDQQGRGDHDHSGSHCQLHVMEMILSAATILLSNSVV